MSADARIDDEVRRGAALYNGGAYFEAHEVWEGLWRDARDARDARHAPTRTLLQGLIQAAAAFHKLHVQRDPLSAARILARAHTKLASIVAGTDPTGHLAISNLAELVGALATASNDLANERPWPRAPELRMMPRLSTE